MLIEWYNRDSLYQLDIQTRVTNCFSYQLNSWKVELVVVKTATCSSKYLIINSNMNILNSLDSIKN